MCAVVSDVAAAEASEVTLSCRVPTEGLQLWGIARRLCQRLRGPPDGAQLEDWQCVELMLDHFIAIWGRHAPEAGMTAHREILERDGYHCQVPGCRNRRNLNVHHIIPRSLGGGDEPENLVTTCYEHHIEGIHAGTVACAGAAPDQLRWRLGRGEAAVSYMGDWATACTRPSAA